MILNEEAARDSMRESMLDALDTWAKATIGDHADGWKDQDLPEFFAGLDAQLYRLCERYGVALVDYDPAAVAAANPAPAPLYRTRADLMNHAAFADLDADTSGNPCVLLNSYECECGNSWDDAWSCGCDDECGDCGDDVSPTESEWIGPPGADLRTLWELLPEAGAV